MYTKSTPYYMIISYQQLSWTEKNDMKNLIIKWLGLGSLIDEVVRMKTRDAVASFKMRLLMRLWST